MKKTKRTLKIMGALMSIALLLTAVVVIGAIAVGATEGQERELIPVPDIPAINRPYKTMDDMGIDFAAIDASFPKNIEVRYEGGKVYIKDIGAGSVSIYASDFCDLELVDGYWTADIEGELQFIYVNSFEDYGEDRYWSATYHGDGTRDPYVVVNDSTKGVYISFTSEYKNATVQYNSGDCYYEDVYSRGVLDEHGVSNINDTDRVEAIYGVNGSLSYGKLYTGTYYYYFPGQGWSSTWGEFTAGDTPEGYEDIDETYFTANKPSLICSAASGDDMLHDIMSTAYCTTLSACKNGCGYAAGTIEHHDWQIVDGKKECSLCDAEFFPDFEFIDRAYNTVEESGFPYAEIKAIFPEVATVKYEDGKYMIKDVGADIAIAYTNIDYINIDLSLVDGWWICELDEEIYNNESVKIFVCFEGELDGIYWNITYTNGKANSDLLLYSMRDDLSVLLRYNEYDWIAFRYNVGDRQYLDEYKNGVLYTQEGSLFVGEDHVYVVYLADGSFDSAQIYIDDEWYYYYPDKGWERGVEALLTPPAGFENADVAYFESILPTTINCAHETYGAADCENPERCLVCGIPKEGSEALGHDIVVDTAVEPTCTETGLTEGSHCSRCDEMTVMQDEIPALGHTEEKVDGKAATCTETGLTDGVKCSVCDEILTAQEEIPALGHTEEIIDGKAATCTETGITDGVKCSVCDEILTAQEEIPMIAHTEEVIDGKAATCTEAGLTDGVKCSVCDEILTAQEEIAATGHDFAAATTEAPKTCKNCGETEGEPLPEENKPAVDDNDDNKGETPDGNAQGGKDEEKSDGCGSIIGVGSIALVAALGVAFVISKKRKE